jgi:hypothetical protein
VIVTIQALVAHAGWCSSMAHRSVDFDLAGVGRHLWRNLAWGLWNHLREERRGRAERRGDEKIVWKDDDVRDRRDESVDQKSLYLFGCSWWDLTWSWLWSISYCTSSLTTGTRSRAFVSQLSLPRHRQITCSAAPEEQPRLASALRITFMLCVE